jgi:hypothetical protein
VDEKKLNRNQSSLTNYPEPDIHVDEAWSGMKKILDDEMPAASFSFSKGKTKYLLLLLLLFSGTAVFLWQNNKQTETKTFSQNNSINPGNTASNGQDVNNSSNNITDAKNYSSPTPGNTDEKEAVANNKKEQQTPAATLSNSVATNKNTTGSGNKGVGTNNTAALSADKIRGSKNETNGTGNNQKVSLAAKKNFIPANNDGAAVILNKKANVALTGDKNLGSPALISSPVTPVQKEPVTAKANQATDEPKTIYNNTSPNIPPSETSLKNEPAVVTTAAIQNNEAGNKATEKTIPKAARKMGFNYGVQWNIALPLQGSKNYFTGTSGSSQPYILLVPDVWVSKQLGKKQELLLLFSFSHQYATGDKQLAASTGRWTILDSTTVIKKLSLSKTSGISLGLQYNYNIDKNWSIGTGINYNKLSSALLNEKITGVYTGTVLSSLDLVAKKNNSDWAYLNSSFFTGKLELSYYLGKIKIGSAVFVPLSNLSSAAGNTVRPVNGQLFLRWRFTK